MRLNLHNQTFKIGVNGNPPFSLFDEGSFEHGSEARFIETISSYYNFSFELVDCDLVWGKKLPNGSWNGIIGRLIDNEVDIGVGGISINYERWELVAFLYPHSMTAITFMTAAPKKIVSSYHLLFRPLSSSVWITFLITLFICFAFDHLQRILYRKKLNLLWMSLVQLFHQDSSHKPNLPRYVLFYMIFWSFGSFILTIAYAGCLYSFIAAPSYSKTIDSIEELFNAIKEKRVFLLSFDYQKYLDDFEYHLDDPSIPIDSFWKPIPSALRGMKLINDSANDAVQYVYVGFRETLKYGQADFGDKFIYIPDGDDALFFNENIAIATIKNFPYYDEFNLALQRLNNNGFMEYWVRKSYEHVIYKRTDNKISKYTPKPFTINQVIDFFIVYFQCIIFSTMVFALEITFKLTHGIFH